MTPSRSTTSTSSARRSRPRSSTRGTMIHRRRRRSEDRRRVHGPHPEGRRLVGRPPSGREGKERVRIPEEPHLGDGHVAELLRMYEKVVRMTGTAETEAAEFAGTTGFRSSRSDEPAMIPRGRADLVFKTEKLSSRPPSTTSPSATRSANRSRRDGFGRAVRAPLGVF